LDSHQSGNASRRIEQDSGPALLCHPERSEGPAFVPAVQKQVPLTIKRCPRNDSNRRQTLKPATELRSSAASFVNCPIDTLVCFVPSVVSSVIFRMPCMPRVTSATDADCVCVCA